MDYDNLNESEITTLINNKKEPKNQEQYDQMYNEVITTLFSQRHSNRTVVLDTLDDNIDYILTTNQTPIETRFTHFCFHIPNIFWSSIYFRLCWTATDLYSHA